MKEKRTNIRKKIESHGYKVVYVSHEIIKDYNACYNVIYDGKIACPNAGRMLGIPINEIWISKKWQPYEEFILYHELQEIKYRAQGHDGKTAHEMAEQDELRLWKDDSKWKRMNREWGIGREHLF